jgi:hypothetical protein
MTFSFIGMHAAGDAGWQPLFRARLAKLPEACQYSNFHVFVLIQV